VSVSRRVQRPCQCGHRRELQREVPRASDAPVSRDRRATHSGSSAILESLDVRATMSASKKLLPARLLRHASAAAAYGLPTCGNSGHSHPSCSRSTLPIAPIRTRSMCVSGVRKKVSASLAFAAQALDTHPPLVSRLAIPGRTTSVCSTKRPCMKWPRRLLEAPARQYPSGYGTDTVRVVTYFAPDERLAASPAGSGFQRPRRAAPRDRPSPTLSFRPRRSFR